MTPTIDQKAYLNPITHILTILKLEWFWKPANTTLIWTISLFLGLPFFGFLSIGTALGEHPINLYYDFQLAVQRTLFPILGLLLLYHVNERGQNPSYQASIRAGGISRGEHLFGCWIYASTLMFVTQFAYMAYLLLVGMFWNADPAAIGQLNHSVYSTTWFSFVNTGSILLMTWVLMAIAQLFWVRIGQSILAFIATITIWVAGLSKSVWLTLWVHAEEPVLVFKVAGYILNFLIPPFFRFDLWQMNENGMLGNMLVHVGILALFSGIVIGACLWISWIHLRSEKN